MNKFFIPILISFCFSQVPYACEDKDSQNQTVCSSIAKSLKQTFSQVGGHLGFLLTPTENPTWGSALYKGSVGFGLYLSSSMFAAHQQIDVDHTGQATILTDSPQATCAFFSANLLFNAVGDAMQLIYVHLRSPTPETITKIKRKILKDEKKNLTEEKVRGLYAENLKRNMDYMSRLGRYTFNSIGMAHGVYLYVYTLNTFFENGINPFALSFPEGYPDCPSSTIFCRPVTTPIFLTLYTATLFYNLRELSFFTDPASFIERGDIPFFSFFNGYGKVGLSKIGRWGGFDNAELDKLEFHKKAYEQEIKKRFGKNVQEIQEFAEGFKLLDANNKLDRNAANYLGMKNVAKSYENYFEVAERYEDYATKYQHHISGLNWFLPLFLRYYGNYQLYESALLILKNLAFYLKDLPYIEEVVDDQRPIPEVHTPKAQVDKIKKNKELRETEENTNPFLPTTSLPQPREEDLHREKNKDYQDTIPKPKKKTRGNPNPNFGKLSEQSAKKSNSNMPIDSKAASRKEGLQNVKSLRDQYPVKANAVTSAIGDLKKFLNAEIEPIQGSEYRLVWRINGKRYAMKYETPHGWDSTNFAGNKLDRILNVLEVGYLIGLNEDQIHTYITANNRYNLLRFGKFLHFLAMNPAK